eukprot:13445027-Ditylum_brightwellii.AAC.1
MPKTSSADAAARAALDLIEAIKHPYPATTFPNIGNVQMAVLQKLSEIFHQALQPMPLPVPQPPKYYRQDALCRLQHSFQPCHQHRSI